METVTRSCYALGGAGIAIILSACTAGTQSVDPDAAPSARAVVAPQQRGLASSLQGRKSWIEPNAKNHRLLYVSDSNNNIVQVYNYPKGSQDPPAGTLTGFNHPFGMCVDSSNNLYFTNNEGFSVFKYAAGASEPSGVYMLGQQLPVGCSIDPTTGNLAVSSGHGSKRQYGAVTICSSTTHCKNAQHPGSLVTPYFVAYTDSGDLYVNGFTALDFGMAYLPKGSSTWQSVNYSGPKGAPGGLQWDGTHLVMSLQTDYPQTLYTCNASGANVDCGQGAVQLLGVQQVLQFFILKNNKTVVAADVYGDAVHTWALPAGGQPKRSIVPAEIYSLLVGTAVVSATK